MRVKAGNFRVWKMSLGKSNKKMKNCNKNLRNKMFLEVSNNCIMKSKKEIEKYLSYQEQLTK